MEALVYKLIGYLEGRITDLEGYEPPKQEVYIMKEILEYILKNMP